MIQRSAYILAVAVANIFFAACTPNTADEKKPVTSDTTTIFDQPTTEKQQPAVKDEDVKEAHYRTATESGFKKTTNERYGFSFEIPDTWKAIDKSNNGDGYFLDCGDKKTDLRIYGENIEGNEIMAEMELKSCERTENFKFANGYPGTICYQSGDTYYYYDTPKIRIVFYVHADSKWKQRNMEAVNTIAKSIDAGDKGF